MTNPTAWAGGSAEKVKYLTEEQVARGYRSGTG